MTAAPGPPPRRAEPFRVALDDDGPLGGLLARTVARTVERALGLDRLGRLYASMPPCGAAEFVRRALDALGVAYRIEEADLARVPAKGGVVVVANHPFGAVEGLVLLDALLRARADVRVLANRLLSRIPELGGLLLPVEVLGDADGPRTNATALRAALRHVRDGGALALFPAGEVAHVRLGEGVTDPPWNPAVARLVRRAASDVVPVFFDGRNGALFQAAGMIHPRVRTALLPRELLNKSARTIDVRVGSPVPAARLAAVESDEDLLALLRLRTYLLGRRDRSPRTSPTVVAPIAAPAPRSDVHDEVARLPADRVLAESAALGVLLVLPGEAPALLHEVGRLRETTFRAVGEGTGRPLDLDDFDGHYVQLVLWDREAGEVAGGYRLARTDKVLRDHGPAGLYTTTLFDLRPQFFARLGPAIELGRSFIAPSRQRSFAPLLLLWKGIGAVVCRHPHLRTLFGPVSISDRYTPFVRRVIVEWLRRNAPADDLSPHVRPRRPLRSPARETDAARRAAATAETAEEMSAIVGDLAPGLGGAPVLVREYLKLAGRFAAFNVDPAFGGVVDGLVAIDLTATPRRTLDRYMGKDGAARFLAYHSDPCPALGTRPPSSP